MATVPERDLDYKEPRARIWRALEEIEKISAETRRIVAEAGKVGAKAKVVPYATIFQGLIAIAGLLGAGAAIAKVFFP